MRLLGRTDVFIENYRPGTLEEMGLGPDVLLDANPDLIIVRRFATPRWIVVLDPSLGFSLDRRQPGVLRARRAASLARATAFILADTITEQLRDGGYDAVQLGFGEATKKSLSRARAGHLKKVDAPPLRHLTEFRDEAGELALGERVTVEAFEIGAHVKVSGPLTADGCPSFTVIATTQLLALSLPWPRVYVIGGMMPPRVSFLRL